MSFADVFCPSYTLVSNLVTSDLHRFCNSLSRQLNAVTVTYVQNIFRFLDERKRCFCCCNSSVSCQYVGHILHRQVNDMQHHWSNYITLQTIMILVSSVDILWLMNISENNWLYTVIFHAYSALIKLETNQCWDCDKATDPTHLDWLDPFLPNCHKDWPSVGT